MGTSLDLQIKMIELLIEKDKAEYGCTIKSFINHTGADKKDIKEIVTILKNAEMIKSDWCINDDGMLSGKAYFLTDRATRWSIREWLEVLKGMAIKELSTIHKGI